MTAQLIGRTGEVTGTGVDVSERLTIGSAPGNGMRIPSPSVSKRHAQIVKTGTEYYVEDLGSRNGTFLNGQRVKRFRIRHLDVLSIGPDIDLIFMEGGTLAPVNRPPSPVRGQIVWLDGPLTGKVQEFAAGRRLMLGRSPELPLEAISRRHAALTFTNEGATVEDLGSVNGTWVNGTRISKATILTDGDQVSLGDVVRFSVAVLRGASEQSASPGEGTEPQTMVLPPPAWKGQRAGDRTLNVPPINAAPTPSVAPSAPTPAPGAVGPEPPVEPAQAPEALPPSPATVVVPRGPVSVPRPLVGAVPTPEPQRAAGGTAQAPRTPLVPPPVGGPASSQPKTVTPAREAAIGVPGALAQRARAARESGDATMAANTPAPARPTPPAAPPPGPPASAKEPATGRIEAARFEGGQTFTLPRGTFEVGRQKDCPVYIDLRDVGRKHARLIIGETGVTVEDLNSANGTFVNDARVSGAAIVNDGGTVRFATVEFTVTYLRSEG